MVTSTSPWGASFLLSASAAVFASLAALSGVPLAAIAPTLFIVATGRSAVTTETAMAKVTVDKTTTTLRTTSARMPFTAEIRSNMALQSEPRTADIFLMGVIIWLLGFKNGELA